MKKISILSILSIIVISAFVTPAYGVSVSIETDKQTYYFGDFLTFAITIDEIKEDLAILFLIDGNGKKSSAIPVPISELKTVETSPFPFEKIVYPEGRWMLEIEYGGAKDTTEFFLKDSGKIVIPVWIKDVGKMWANDLITGEHYVSAIEFLVREEIIIIPEIEIHERSDQKLPPWIKTTTTWWSEGMISDHEYAKSLEYLIKAGIIIV